MKFANVIVDISHEKLDKIFQYIIPEHLQSDIYPGVKVNIPFGKANREITGYVIEITDQSEYEPDKLKEIQRVCVGSIPIEAQMIALAAWMKEHTGCTMNQALKTVIPIKRKIKGKEKISVSLNISEDEALRQAQIYEQKKNTISRGVLLRELVHRKSIDRDEIVNVMHISQAIINGMKKSNLIRFDSSKEYRNPVVLPSSGDNSKHIELNPEQKRVVEDILLSIKAGDMRPHLIHGVTGSGKTEVYMELIEQTLREGKEAIVLIPEISLTYQMVMRFYGRFRDKVSIINSRLSMGEKYDQFERAREGKVSVMIGPRSALFTPFAHLGLIIIDEEHESAYKSESSPRYHAVDTAIYRGKLSGATVVLGSATPSVTSYFRAESGRYVLHTLNNRAAGSEMAEVSVVDMREELRLGNRSIFSNKLDKLIRHRLENNQQVMLFINRRGYANFVSCRACGKAIKCPHCDVTLKYHNDGVMRCHYCGYEMVAPKVCPECSSRYIAPFGTGTQKVEEAVKKSYPSARILRMDMDTTGGKEGHNDIISEFANHEADILIGTQMIVKGHDFPLVTLVGVLAADLSLYASDYTASERTFQLLTQAAGRAGRGRYKGDVVIQTYSPEENCIVAAAHQSYDEFYREEISYRKLMGYPPSASLLTIQIASASEEKAEKAAEELYKTAKEFSGEYMIIGPAKASVYKVNDIYRNMIYIKGRSDFVELQRLFDQAVNDNALFADVNVQYDYENIEER